ncbi:chloride channel protein [Thalassotalea agariperforans]
MSVISNFRKRLALPQTSWQLCILAIIGGSAAASMVILFSLTIDAIKAFYAILFDNYNSLNLLSRLLLPLSGIIIIILLSWLTGYKYTRAGIPFVLHRLKVSYGVMPLRNTINQFFGGAFALASGFSVGKEGPSVHLGAACAGYIGNKLNLPYNSIRTLCACGIAAGISACFNTPIAAVMFVMEVILREYKVHVFIPIMLAAIIGSLITQYSLGSVHELEFFVKFSLNITYYPYLVIFGIFIGILASLFNHQLIYLIKRFQHIFIVKRLIFAALITALLSYLLPNAYEGGMSQVSFALSNQWQFQLIATALLAKFLMTIIALGLGIPGGVIGPILSIGAIAGVLASLIIGQLTGNAELASDFALMGMAGFMAATLNAPLAALLAVVELSNQLEVIVPAMVIIATSCLASGQFFKNRSLFIMQLDIQNLTYRKPPIESFLQNIGVLGVMKENFIFKDEADIKQNLSITDTSPNDDFILSKQPFDNGLQFFWHEAVFEGGKMVQKKHQLIALNSQSTLGEAYAILHNIRFGGVYIYHQTPDNLIGIIPFEQIRRYLTQGQLQ